MMRLVDTPQHPVEKKPMHEVGGHLSRHKPCHYQRDENEHDGSELMQAVSDGENISVLDKPDGPLGRQAQGRPTDTLLSYS